MSARFRLGPEAVELLRPLLGEERGAPSTVTFTRSYKADRPSGGFTPALQEKVLPRETILAAIKTFGKEAARFTPDLPDDDAAALRATLGALADSLRERANAGPDDLHCDDGCTTLRELRSQITQVMTAAAKPSLEEVLSAVEEALDVAEEEFLAPRVLAALWQLVPVFIYFENYSIVTSAVYLPSHVENLPQNIPGSEVRTINTLFRHVGLSAKDLLDLGVETAQNQHPNQRNEPAFQATVKAEEDRKHLRAIKVSSASQDMTQRFAEWFTVRDYRFRFSGGVTRIQ